MANPILQLLEALRNMFTCDIGIDLGTANTLVYMKGRGIIIREPSVVAVDARTDELRVRCVGHEAKAIIGAAPNSILAVRPLKDGVIADFDITAAMLQSFIRQACGSRLFVRPRVVICVPSGVTEVERRAVRQAAANGRDCWLALQRTTGLSPAAGQIAKRGVQAGEVVSPGTPLMTVIPLHRLWIDANFKEVQLHKMRIGQPAVIRVDMYGGDVTYHGRVTGFSAGTGSAFSLLPPQNATGNWIKIVQRVPVRIEIDPADLREHPLLVGLSAVVKVDTSDTSGRLLAASARTEPVPGDLVSQAPAVDFAPVEATISGIIRDNALPGVCPVQGKP